MTKLLTALAIAALCACSSNASAQTMLERAVISPAGGHAANSTTMLDATIAQPATGIATNGQTVMQYGFWNTSALAPLGVQSTATSGFDLTLSPNPAMTQSSAVVTIPQPTSITMSLIDDKGAVVQQITDTKYSAGSHTVPIDLSTVSSGSYTLAVRGQGVLLTKRLTVIH